MNVTELLAWMMASTDETAMKNTTRRRMERSCDFSQYDIKAPDIYNKLLAVLDYISGMTDVYALDIYRKINGNSLPAV